MVWVRLADDFTDHPKIVQAGPLAGWLYVCGLAYANKYATDGFIPSAAVRRLADVEQPSELTERLVAARLWETVEGGFRIHDYSEYQPSAEDVKRDREAAAKRQAEYRKRRSEARNGARNGNGDALLTGESPPPVPGPGPARPGPGPALTSSPQPPPQAEGELPPNPPRGARKPRGERRNGHAHQEAEGPQSEGVTPVTTSDREVWVQARAAVTGRCSDGNAELIRMLEPIGRAADGGLHLRAPPGHGLARFRGQIALALLDAGDPNGPRVLIVED